MYFVWAVRQLTLTSAPRWPSFFLSFLSFVQPSIKDQCAIPFDLACVTQTQTCPMLLLERLSFFCSANTPGEDSHRQQLWLRKTASIFKWHSKDNPAESCDVTVFGKFPQQIKKKKICFHWDIFVPFHKYPLGTPALAAEWTMAASWKDTLSS